MLTEYVSAAVTEGWEKHVIAEQKSPIYLYVKDIDKDGDLDVASTTNRHPGPFNSEVAWFQNNINIKKPWKKFIISPCDPVTSPVANANGIVVADIDADGYEDVAVASGMAAVERGSVYWFKAPKDPAGKWQRFDIELNINNSYFKIYTIDANEDGKNDIVSGGNRGSVLFVNPGKPAQAGARWEKISLPEDDGKTGSSIYVDDLNGDGRVDIVNSFEGDAKKEFKGNVSWFDVSWKGKQAVFRRNIIDPDLPGAFDDNLLDVNGDEKKDVIVSVFKEPYIYWYEAPSKKDGQWLKHLITSSLKGTDISTGDIDADGKGDFAVSGLFQKKVSWFKYKKNNGTWSENVIDNDIKFPGDISLDDLDGDGDLDVVIAGMGLNQMLWYENKIR